MIEKIEAPDAGTAVFTLKYPYGGFADILSDRQVKITPRDALGEFATKPVGTVWIAWARAGREPQARRFVFAGDRATVRAAAVLAALDGVLERLDGDP